MISISVVFWIFIALFALIGMLRGWAKELLVMFSLILALFIIQVIETYVPPVAKMLSSTESKTSVPFFIWSGVIVLFALFGYHVPGINKLAGTKLSTTRDRLQDWLLGGIIGACNGYLLVGTVWHYLDTTGYPFAAEHMTIPSEAAQNIIAWLPPAWLHVPYIYFAVIIAFTILVVVFI